MAFADAKCTKFSFIVNPGSVNDHDRTKRQKLLRFFDNVGGRTRNIGSNGYLLTGNQV